VRALLPPLLRGCGSRRGLADAREPRIARPALIPFICAGDPNLATTAKALRALDDVRAGAALRAALLAYPCVGSEAQRPCSRAGLQSDPRMSHAQAGADIIELGVPYSDPLADGPVIQAAATRALAGGATLDKVLQLVKEVRVVRGVACAILAQPAGVTHAALPRPHGR
jgi:hypothetical protein